MVDDNKTDRYMIKRRLSQADGFEVIAEFQAGDAFLEQYFVRPAEVEDRDQPTLILLDINMPRWNGFQTVAEIEAHLGKQGGSAKCVVMMCTTSESAEDMAEAKRHALIRGYVVKPIGVQDVEDIRRRYHTCLAER